MSFHFKKDKKFLVSKEFVIVELVSPSVKDLKKYFPINVFLFIIVYIHHCIEIV
jgi:hypothetical protein